MTIFRLTMFLIFCLTLICSIIAMFDSGRYLEHTSALIGGIVSILGIMWSLSNPNEI